jgi:hypothetical protein
VPLRCRTCLASNLPLSGLSDLSLASDWPPSKLSALFYGCCLLLQGHGTVWSYCGLFLSPLLGCTYFPLAVAWSVEFPVGVS